MAERIEVPELTTYSGWTRTGVFEYPLEELYGLPGVAHGSGFLVRWVKWTLEIEELWYSVVSGQADGPGADRYAPMVHGFLWNRGMEYPQRTAPIMAFGERETCGVYDSAAGIATDHEQLWQATEEARDRALHPEPWFPWADEWDGYKLAQAAIVELSSM